MFRYSRVRPMLAAIASSTTIGCIPYTVATTATPVPRDSTVRSMAFTVMPGAQPSGGRGTGWLSMDAEARRGIDSLSDVGGRLVSGAGVVFNYKRLLTGTDAGTHISIMPGAGILHLGDHAHLEMTVLASPRDGGNSAGRRASRVTPYGGLRVMQVIPLRDVALHDEAVAGAFLGLRIGTTHMGVSPEVGVFYDRSAMKMRRSNIVIVPALVVHGEELLGVFNGHVPRRGRPR